MTKKITNILLLLIIVAAIPLTVFISQKRQETRQRAENNMAIGFNLRGAIHYGKGDILPYSNASDVDADLLEIQKMGGTIIRIFAANNKVPDDEAAKRLDAFLTKASLYNISVIAVLTDFYNSGSNPQGTDNYYTDNWNGIGLLNFDFFNGGYKDRYETFVKTVINYNKNHSNIYAWEPGNELKYDKSPQTFVSFMKDITDTIKSLDPNHPVATGMLNAGHTALSPDALYGQLPSVDIISIHPYNGDHGGEADILWAKSNGKPVVAEEFGFVGTNDRTQMYINELEYLKNLGVNAVLQWGFIAKGLGDNGDGDRNSGMDTIWHTADYDLLFNLFKSYGCPAGNCDLPLEVTTLSVNPTVIAAKETTSISVAGKGSNIRIYLHEGTNLSANDRSIGAYDPNKIEAGTFYLVGIANAPGGSNDISTNVINITPPAKKGTYSLVANSLSSDGKTICAWDKKIYNVGTDGKPAASGKICANPSPITFSVEGDVSSRPPSASIMVKNTQGGRYDFETSGWVAPYLDTKIFKGEIYAAKIKDENAKTIEDDYGLNCGQTLPTQQKGWCLLTREGNLDTLNTVINGSWTPQSPGSYWITANFFSTGGQCSGNPTVSYPYYPDIINTPDYYYQPCDRDGDATNGDLIKIVVTGGPTSTGGPSVTPTPTGTQITPTVSPTPTTSPTPTPGPNDTLLSFNLILTGLGQGRGNANPVHKEKSLTVCIYDPSVDPTGDNSCSKALVKKTGPITYNSSSGTFENSNFNIGIFNYAVKPYIILVKTNKYLRKRIPQGVNIASGQKNTVPQTILILGDINEDNIINILDYNFYLSCYNKKVNSASCADKDAVDLNDDGKTDTPTNMTDFKFLFAAFSTQKGD
ncbi:MAG: cellulase family glycosylhydrolase [Candidatus Levybacteria bacterium]|nr:cellulase family glycosylhydrolase [Candidatus Levybacteria bacterium]